MGGAHGDRPALLAFVASVELPELEIDVQAVVSGTVMRFRFEFRRDPEGMPACLMAWGGVRLQAVAQPPGEGSIRTEDMLGPMTM
jgi:hypothetical protein